MGTYHWYNKDTFDLDELVMYGSSRLGTIGANQYLTDTITRDSAWWAAHPIFTNPLCDSINYDATGLKQYEFTNHLGNVLVTLTDKHIPNYSNWPFVSYNPEVASAQDYYPFGMEMVGRAYNPKLYRFGFTGQEKDNEIEGEGNFTTAFFWEYDSRIGRRWNVDPKPAAWESNYEVDRDDPVLYNDPNGDCPNCITAAIGAGIGAVIGGGIEIGSQLYHEGKVGNWKAVAGSAAQGAVTGGVAGFTGGASLLVTAGAAGIANAAGGAINNTIQGKPITARSVITDVSIGAVFGAGGKYVGNKIGQFFQKANPAVEDVLPSVDEIFTDNIESRTLAEKLAIGSKYKGFENANEVLRKNNPVFDLINKSNDVVDVTTTDAKKLGYSQFTKKLDALSELGGKYQNRTLQIYTKAGQYSETELKTLNSKLNAYITENKLTKVSVSIDQVKK